jgi:hypothetical protein
MRGLVLFSFLVAACHDNNTTNNNNGTMDLSATATDGGEDMAVIMCGLIGDACAGDSDCCSTHCDPNAHICIQGMCKDTGMSCMVPTECCNLTCVAGQCGGMCIPDNTACTNSPDCCSGQCVNNSCKPLNTMCSTSGNPCTVNTDAGVAGNCCSGLCSNGMCSIGASYCVQVGDVCYQAGDCCTGVCTKAAGATAGTCGALVGSPVSCKVDGVVCGGCGDCCSRLCAPFAASGVDICQPASGCHVYGDLCRKDSDCCGGEAPDAGLPGGGLVACTMIPGTGLGYCDHPGSGKIMGGQTCNPEGNVCHFQNYAGTCANSSDRNDCCACIAKKDCCKIDSVGIPRCNGIGGIDGGIPCVPVGGNCTFDGNCCNGAPCVPDSTGQLKCGAGTDGGSCVPKGGPCTSTQDCCAGVTCIIPPGALSGVCDVIAPVNDMGMMCAEIGQSCEVLDCCAGLNCTDSGGFDCTTSRTGCTCTVIIK